MPAVEPWHDGPEAIDDGGIGGASARDAAQGVEPGTERRQVDYEHRTTERVLATEPQRLLGAPGTSLELLGITIDN